MNAIFLIYGALDALLLPVYRFPDNPLAGYYLGTALLSVASIMIGKYSASLAFRFNREGMGRYQKDMHQFQGLSLEALKAGNRPAFRACNGIANEAYGKEFFLQIALSAASLWPVFIALGWMQERFAGISVLFPGTGITLGYAASFLLLYVPLRFIISKAVRICKNELPA